MTYSHGPYSVQVDQVTEAQWNSLLDRFADASLYQTWAYGAVSWGERQLSHLVMLQDGVEVAMAQVRLVRVPLLGSGIAYVRWGPVCRRIGEPLDPALWRAATEALIAEYVDRRGLTLRLLPAVLDADPAATVVSATLEQAGFVLEEISAGYRTLLVDLRRPADALRSGLAHKWRNQLNAAERNELEVVEGSDNVLYEEFTTIYSEMMERKRFDTSVSVGEFAQIQARLPVDQKMWILVARRNGRPLSALVGSTIGSTGIYLLGATGDEGMKAKGSYVLQWRFMQRLKAKGCDWYDLGGINPEVNPGVYHFKQGLGGTEASQIHAHDLHRNPLSKLAVSAAERMRTALGRRRTPTKGGTAPEPETRL